jgi:DNA-binding winged helix-turn-helix (wHTH) protein
MSTQPAPSLTVQFGPFEFDAGSGELRKGRTRIKLQGQPLQILSCLISNPRRVVGRDELQRILWPGAVSGDFEHGLSAAVNKLRQALSDSADQPRYIETLPGRGYQWIAPLHSPLRTVLEISRPAVPPPPPQKKWRTPYLRGVVVAVAVLFVAGIVFGLRALQLREPEVSHTSPVRFAMSPPPGMVCAGGRKPAVVCNLTGRRQACLHSNG